MNKSKGQLVLRVALTVAVAAGALCLGYRAGQGSRSLAMDSASRDDPHERSEARSGRRSDPAAKSGPMTSPEARAKRVAEIKEQVMTKWKQRAARTDWESEREIAALLSSLDAQELDEFYGELFHVGEVARLRLLILDRWVLKDPEAALSRCIRNFRDRPAPNYAIRTWADHDREAALAWLARDDLPASLAGRRESLKRAVLLNQGDFDFERVKAEFPRMSSRERVEFLKALAGPPHQIPEERLRLLAEAGGDAESAIEVQKGIVARLATTDPAAARERIATMDLPEAQRVELELSLLQGESSREPVAAFESWMARHSESEAVPPGFWPVLDNAFNQQFDKMVAWMDALPEGAQRDSLYQRGVRLVANRNQFEKGADYAADIADPATRHESMRVLRSLWMAGDPAAAEKWLNRLPVEDREALAPVPPARD